MDSVTTCRTLLDPIHVVYSSFQLEDFGSVDNFHQFAASNILIVAAPERPS